MALLTNNPDQNEEGENELEIDDLFQDSNIRLGTRMNMQRIRYNIRNRSTFQNVLVAILLIAGFICVGLAVTKNHSELPISTDGCALSKRCQNGGTCVDEVSSFRCICTDEFAGNICEKANKCRYPGTCAAPNTPGNCYRCRDGFVKDPEVNMRCKYAHKNASLIISLRTDIRIISLDGLHLIKRMQEGDSVRGMDYNFQTNTIFWFSASDLTIYKAQMNEEFGKESIMHDSLSGTWGLAVDWIHSHLYWLDDRSDGSDQIGVSNFQGTWKKILFSDGLSFPISIAINPLNGWMYWTDDAHHRIERAAMDGSRREVILSTNILHPIGLMVDYTDNRLYWSQGRPPQPSSIWSCKFDGSDRTLIFTSNRAQLYGSLIAQIATFDKYIYFVEFISNTVYKVNKCNGGELSRIHTAESTFGDIKIYHKTTQPARKNLCLERIGGRCSHFCLPLPYPGDNGSVNTTTTCACPDGLSLSNDQLNCV